MRPRRRKFRNEQRAWKKKREKRPTIPDEKIGEHTVIELDFVRENPDALKMKKAMANLSLRRRELKETMPKFSGKDLEAWRKDFEGLGETMARTAADYLTELIDFAKQKKASPETIEYFQEQLRRVL
jgi:hypothetical protein